VLKVFAFLRLVGFPFVANIYFYDIETPLKQFVSSRQNRVRQRTAIHETVMRG